MRKHDLANGNGGAAVEKETSPFRAGDTLTRAEFLRRWEQNSQIKYAELIGGIVYMPSPTTFLHGETQGEVACWLGTYAANTEGVKHGTNSTTFMEQDSPQPDEYLRILPECGGAVRPAGKYLRGAAELIAEICLSSAAYDLHQKLKLYEKAGVQEYLAVLMYEQQIRWHCLGESGYELLEPTRNLVWKSSVFPGLWLDSKALLAGDSAKLLRTLNRGLRSPEHAAFVKKLARKKKK